MGRNDQRGYGMLIEIQDDSEHSQRSMGNHKCSKFDHSNSLGN
jgi:hypothetical protein